jgi:hypothetical protein
MVDAGLAHAFADGLDIAKVAKLERGKALDILYAYIHTMSRSNDWEIGRCAGISWPSAY